MRFVSLGSGSQGNAALVELGLTRILVDAGLSARELTRRLEAIGVEPRRIDWILLSHEHSDHARGAERFSRKHGVPVVCARATLEALDLAEQHLAEWIEIPDDGRVDLGAIRVDAFPVPHDAARPLGFVLHDGACRVGVATDLGHATTLVLQRLRGCDLIMIESNHDPVMLRDGPYPWALKQRVASRYGHLSNAEAAAVVKHAVADASRAVVLGHLSEKNNTPELARRTVRRALGAVGRADVEVHVAAPRATSEPVRL